MFFSLSIRAQSGSTQVSIDLDIANPPLVQNHQFEFIVRYPNIPQNKNLVFEIRCSPGIDCVLKQDAPSSAGHQLTYTATIKRIMNLAEVQATLRDGPDKIVGNISKGIDLGFSEMQPHLATNLQIPLTAGEDKIVHIWFENKANQRFKPTASVQIILSSDNQCADFRYLERQNLLGKSGYDPSASVTILNDHEEPDGYLYIRPHTWFANVCTVEFSKTVAGTLTLGREPLDLHITPAIWPSVFMCFAGVFANFLISGVIQLIASVKAGRPLTLWSIFIGQQGSEVLGAVIKGLLAYLASIVITTSSVFGIQVDRTTLVGFFTLGFMIGFWPVEKLWGLFRPSQAGPANTQGQP